MLDLFLDIIDRIKGLINARKESNKELFDGFVTPLYDKFCAMHKEYMKSFREYRKMLKSDSYPFDEKQLIFDRIKTDSLFPKEVRSELLQVEPLSPVVKPLYELIRTYLLSAIVAHAPN